MADEYTPDTESVRRAYQADQGDRYADAPDDVWRAANEHVGGAEGYAGAEFDRWLAGERAVAWDEGRNGRLATNPYIREGQDER